MDYGAIDTGGFKGINKKKYLTIQRRKYPEEKSQKDQVLTATKPSKPLLK